MAVDIVTVRLYVVTPTTDIKEIAFNMPVPDMPNGLNYVLPYDCVVIAVMRDDEGACNYVPNNYEKLAIGFFAGSFEYFFTRVPQECFRKKGDYVKLSF